MFESFSDKSYDEIKEELTKYMMNLYGFDRNTALGIIEYENTDPTNIGYEYDALKDYMTEVSTIEELSDMMMMSDEGEYQFDIIKDDPEKYKYYLRQKEMKKFKI